MSLTSAVITNDSGLMHVAAALGKYTIAIFGSTDPLHTPPLSKKTKVLYLGLPCSPCFKRECPLKHLKCLKDLPPEQALNALQNIK
jgi:heptosyltransferase-2